MLPDEIHLQPFVMECFPSICHLFNAVEVTLFAIPDTLHSQLRVTGHQKEPQAIGVEHFELPIAGIAVDKDIPAKPVDRSNTDFPDFAGLVSSFLQGSGNTLLDGFGGLVSKGEGDDRGGIRALRNQPGDAVGEGPGLPRPSARDNQNVRIRVHDGSELVRRQFMFQDGVDIAHWSFPFLDAITV